MSVCVCVYICIYSVIFAWGYSLRLKNVAKIKNRYFYSKTVSVLNELFFDILICKKATEYRPIK